MANIYWNRDKKDREQVVNELMDLIPDYTESRFMVKPEGDDSGSYITIYVERDENQKESCSDLPQIYGGWRVVHVYTPHEYIKYILDSKNGEG